MIPLIKHKGHIPNENSPQLMQIIVMLNWFLKKKIHILEVAEYTLLWVVDQLFLWPSSQKV